MKTLSQKIAHLNPKQQRAVQTTEGRVLILAGAGSGKTSVLTHRIAYIIEQGYASPEEILGLTFTNKAAGEMRERVANLVGKEAAKKITLCTFHSFCMKVLRKDIDRLGYTKNFTIYNERDVRRLMQQLEEEGGDYDVSMRAFNAVDFDSMLTLTIELFEKFPDVLEKYQNQCRYVMIDEYQDTNPIQYKLTALLTEKYGNLCVVGDDDQSIYGWRGAEIKHILQFSSATTIKLEQNYRSTPLILKAANAVIRNNTERHDKELWSSYDEGERITLFHAPTDENEAESVAQRLIAFRKRHNLRWKDMAILYRSNILARPLESALMRATWDNNGEWKRGIPYTVYGGVEFYERSEIKDLIAYLKVILNRKDEQALLRIINVPRRGIADRSLDLLTSINRKKKLPLWSVLSNESLRASEEKKLTERAEKSLSHFVSIIEEATTQFTHNPLHNAMQWLIDKINYTKAIEEEVKSEKMRDVKKENVKEFLSHLENYENSLDQFMSEITLDEDPWKKTHNDFRVDKVSLMTFHGSKGLEFPACFLVGLEDKIMPHEKSMEDTGLEEERRLMYVAMTRAKKHLTISMAQKRVKMGKEIKCIPSPFLYEIPKELLKVTHWHNIEDL